MGDEFEHHWGRTFSAGESALFSTSLCWWSPMYLDEAYAVAHGYDDVLVNPFLVLCTIIGLSVEDLSEGGGPFLGIEECRFPTPVHPGDTLTASSVVLAVRRSKSRPGSGIVTWRTTGRNQRSEVICAFERTNLIAGGEVS